MAWIKDAPNPGSKEALKKGCTCAVVDNCHGRGYFAGKGFVITQGCPLHDIEEGL